MRLAAYCYGSHFWFINCFSFGARQPSISKWLLEPCVGGSLLPFLTCTVPTFLPFDAMTVYTPVLGAISPDDSFIILYYLLYPDSMRTVAVIMRYGRRMTLKKVEKKYVRVYSAKQLLFFSSEYIIPKKESYGADMTYDQSGRWTNTLPPLHKKAIKVNFEKVFWLFLFGSILGVLLEGFWCLCKYGAWETHVVSLYGPYCILYGLGMAGCYFGAAFTEGRDPLSKFLFFALIGDTVEYSAGFILEYGLRMHAWNYARYFMNVDGHICLLMTVVWGSIGVLFGLIVPKLDRLLERMSGYTWHIVSIAVAVPVALDIMASLVCIARWSDRHYRLPAETALERFIDEHFDDRRMSKRFIEWRFIESKPKAPEKEEEEASPPKHEYFTFADYESYKERDRENASDRKSVARFRFLFAFTLSGDTQR